MGAWAAASIYEGCPVPPAYANRAGTFFQFSLKTYTSTYLCSRESAFSLYAYVKN